MSMAKFAMKVLHKESNIRDSEDMKSATMERTIHVKHFATRKQRVMSHFLVQRLLRLMPSLLAAQFIKKLT